ncbi:MAG TPA: heme exporter protein CcmD [Sphingomonas sp.]|nr:heme exporter protein CcmD [Sphingomonas sp.]
MSHWPYIIAAYALTIGGMAGLALVSWLRMRTAERDAEAVRRK